MKILLTALTLILSANSVFAAETLGEKIDAKTNDAKRTAKGIRHRAEEATCDQNCLKKKAKNRGEEVKDYSKDKLREGENAVDD